MNIVLSPKCYSVIPEGAHSSSSVTSLNTDRFGGYFIVPTTLPMPIEDSICVLCAESDYKLLGNYANIPRLVQATHFRLSVE